MTVTGTGNGSGQRQLTPTRVCIDTVAFLPSYQARCSLQTQAPSAVTTDALAKPAAGVVVNGRQCSFERVASAIPGCRQGSTEVGTIRQPAAADCNPSFTTAKQCSEPRFSCAGSVRTAQAICTKTACPSPWSVSDVDVGALLMQWHARSKSVR